MFVGYVVVDVCGYVGVCCLLLVLIVVYCY